GTAGFDLSTAGLSQARYIKVVDDGNFSSGQYAGFDLDAIKFFATTGIEEEQIAHFQSHVLNLSVSPNPFREKTEIEFSIGQSAEGIELKIYDASGRLVKDFSRLTLDALRPTQIIWDGTDQNDRMVPAGVYFVRFESGDYSKTEKAILLR
ncbi:T9SS type A sorting domain-containing protein, partial [candidate division WOR-3 bacterium]|nr:T9SS type A sorting domain-containing protein [candidate division WOR-3 bacterium]